MRIKPLFDNDPGTVPATRTSSFKSQANSNVVTVLGENALVYCQFSEMIFSPRKLHLFLMTLRILRK
jgi:hypothetical protein